MCFVLDANSYHCMFNSDSNCYDDFKPLHDWLFGKDRTSLVIGGTTYKKEIRKMKKYWELLKELKNMRLVSDIQDDKVDEEEKRIADRVNDKNFNDPHLIALLCVSRCVIFASKDKRAFPYVKMYRLYPKGYRPKIYHNSNNADKLLCDKNIVSLRNLCN